MIFDYIAENTTLPFNLPGTQAAALQAQKPLENMKRIKRKNSENLGCPDFSA